MRPKGFVIRRGRLYRVIELVFDLPDGTYTGNALAPIMQWIRFRLWGKPDLALTGYGKLVFEPKSPPIKNANDNG